MKLKNIVISALAVVFMTVGLTSFIGTGLNEYNVSSNIDQTQFEQLEKIENATSISTQAGDKAANVESKSNYFNLPGVVKTGKLTFQALQLWDEFFTIIMDITGLDHAAQDWPLRLATSVMTVSVAFIFARRWF